MKSLYLLALLPPPDLSSQINEIRKECSEKFKVYKALKHPVHITLYRPISMEETFEKKFIQLMKSVGRTVKPFTQELENFHEFNSQVICIRALKSAELNDLRQSIVSVFRKHRIDPKETKGSLAFIPHITIAYRDVLPEVFPLIWEEYKDQKFKKKFLAERFSLLKHDLKQWNVLEEFRLLKAEQPSLF
ncbi:MAG TPA: 2'-5' RNA ligase family protein [Sphingobacteriaceae bacterium]|nr:2'-5' RNA ligase family protein [Sphingobacteriaceae bacterium]